MKKENIIIKNTPNGPIPVLIDFGLMDVDNESIGDLANILLEVMKKFVKRDSEKINMLSKDLTEIECYSKVNMMDFEKKYKKNVFA